MAPVASANPVAPSCLAVQLGALAAGSDFADVPAFRDTQFLTDPAASPDRQVATSFTRAAAGAVAGDGATVFVRAVDVVAVSEVPSVPQAWTIPSAFTLAVSNASAAMLPCLVLAPTLPWRMCTCLHQAVPAPPSRCPSLPAPLPARRCGR